MVRKKAEEEEKELKVTFISKKKEFICPVCGASLQGRALHRRRKADSRQTD